ncbi:hypothetical protein AB0H20_27950 [Nocardia fluminea]|uniref:hypothetical protein n=1 Tax=Nocardia fluminea TaxID=134984 RepID=UPI0033CD21ED
MVDPAAQVALISLPTLVGFRLRHRPRGAACVLAGMVRANRPWQLVAGRPTSGTSARSR